MDDSVAANYTEPQRVSAAPIETGLALLAKADAAE